MKETILVLGASSDQLFIIKTAQAMGLRVLTVDMNPKSKGFEIADDYSVISTKDVPAICNFLNGYQSIGQKVVGVITMGSDIPDIVAAINHYLGTPGISSEAARLATNKYEMKVRFREQGIPVPWFDQIQSQEELTRAISEQGYPLVIKPIDSSGSRGVFLLEEGCNPDELFLKSMSFSRSGLIQVEKFLEGLQISTETVMYRGQGITPGFADRNYQLFERFKPQIMENGGWVPSILSSEERHQVEDLVVRASLALGVTDGITKGDVVMTNEGPQMIEMAARLSGGDFCESLVPLGIGVNYVEAAIKIAIGEQPDFQKLRPRFQQSVANRYFFPDPGILVRIEGVEDVQKQDWVKKLEFWYQPGDVIPPALSHAHRFGVFVVVGNTREEVAQRVEWVYRTINIITR